MNLIERACSLHRRTLKPWVVPQAFHMHPATARDVDRECRDMQVIGYRGDPDAAHLREVQMLKGVPLVRDPRVPRGVIALQFKNTAGWPVI